MGESMKRWIESILLVLIVSCPCQIFSQACVYPMRDLIPKEPAFEKIYICQNQLLTTPEGRYYVNPNGEQVKVRALLQDCEGTYIIVINHQCPLCGRCWEGAHSHDDYDCPIYQKEVVQNLWSD